MYKILDEIRNTSSTKKKEELVRHQARAGNDNFFRVMTWVFDPILSFGVKKIPIRAGTDGPGLQFSTFSKLANSLIKRDLTGHAALDAINDVKDHATNDEWNRFYRLVLIRDIDCGFGGTIVNKAVKGINDKYLIAETPYMRCSLPDSSNMKNWNWKTGIFSQIKADGSFANVNVDDNKDVLITTRNGTIYPEGCLEIEDDLSHTFEKSTQTHGEFLVQDSEGNILPREKGNGILNSLLKGGNLSDGHKVIFVAWDQIPLERAKSKGKYEMSYGIRFYTLENQIHSSGLKSIEIIETLIVYSHKEAIEHYRSALKRGLEGTVVKNRGAIWEDKTSKDQVKLKLEVDVDLILTGFNPGEGKNAATFGSAIYESSDGELVVNVSGFSDELRQEIHENREDWLYTIGTVRGNSYTVPENGRKYSIYLPRFIERRDDKTDADSLQRVIGQFEAAIQ